MRETEESKMLRTVGVALCALFVLVGGAVGVGAQPASQPPAPGEESGQTTPDAQPVYGRMYQTPVSDRIRNEGGIPTIAVGNITDADQVNSIITAGRADLVALARPHLADPHWTLRAAAQLGYTAQHWPPQYLTGKRQLERLFERQREEEANAP